MKQSIGFFPVSTSKKIWAVVKCLHLNSDADLFGNFWFDEIFNFSKSMEHADFVC